MLELCVLNFGPYGRYHSCTCSFEIAGYHSSLSAPAGTNSCRGNPAQAKRATLTRFAGLPVALQGDTVSSNTILIPAHYPPSWLVPNQRKGLAAIDFPSEARSEIQCSNIRHQNLILLRQDTKNHPDLSTLVEKITLL